MTAYRPCSLCGSEAGWLFLLVLGCNEIQCIACGHQEHAIERVAEREEDEEEEE